MSDEIKIAFSISPNLLERLDKCIKDSIFKNRSDAIQIAITRIVETLEHRRLATESAKLDPNFEKRMADEGLAI